LVLDATMATMHYGGGLDASPMTVARIRFPRSSGTAAREAAYG
jgi:hypothetical protein